MKTKAFTMGFVAIVLTLSMTAWSPHAAELGPANPETTEAVMASDAVSPEAVLGPYGIFVPGPSPVPPFTGTTIDFEGLLEGTLINVQFIGQGVTFTQDDGGTPMIDNKPFLYAYESSTGEGVLTGSMTGGAPYPTVAGIVAEFSSPVNRVGAFLTDTGPLGNYIVTIYDTDDVVIDTLTVLASDFPAIPGYPSPCPECDPMPPWEGTGCGVFVGFDVGSSIISKIQFGPSDVDGDAFAIDDLLFEATQKVPVDIKPTSCPNPLHVASKGVLPIAILSTPDFDATQVDPLTVRLAGVEPLCYAIEDVATPFEPFTGKEDCLEDCTEAGPDGLQDVTLKFDTQEISAALDGVEDGECRVLKLTGNLMETYGDISIEGEDVVVIKKKK